MRKGCWFTRILVPLCLLSPLAAMSALEREVAPIAHSRVTAAPIWVSASVAFTPSGDLREDLFSPAGRRRLYTIRDMNGAECTYGTGFPSLGVHTPTGSIELLARHATAIIRGKVVAAEVGFYREHPGTLFSVRVSQRLRDSDGEPQPTVHLFVGAGEVDTPHGMICGVAPRGTPLPAVGDDVMFFAPGPPIDSENEIFVIEPDRQLLVQSAAKELQLPKQLRTEAAPADLDAVVARVRQVLREGPLKVPR